MKDSGVQWIGLIPDDWRTIKCKYISNFINGYSFNGDELSKDGSYPVIRIGDIKNGCINFNDCLYIENNTNLENFKICKNDILLAMSGATVGKIGIAAEDYDAYINQRVGIIRTEDYQYLSFCLSTNEFIEYVMLDSAGTAQPNVSTEGYNNFEIPFPNKITKDKIVNFLDKKCSEIQSAIDNTKQTIEEYKKLKQAVITKAVTKGIRENRKLKDSGIEWIGQIPDEWDNINPKALFGLRKQKAIYGERQLTASQQYGIVYQDDYMKMTGSKVVTVMKDFDILKHVESGDFVISMRSFQGGIEYSEKTGSISSAYVMLIPNLKYVFPRYYRWLLKCQGYITALNGTTDLVRDGQAMRYSNFAQVRLIKVPIDEQKEIADYLDKKCANIDTLISQKEQFITELEKYKQSLIYEYVTGKKEVK